MTTLITGARGNIGRLLVDTLAAAGHPVRATARDPRTLDLPNGVDTAALDLTAADDIEDVLSDIDTMFLYPTFGDISAFLAQARDAGVRYTVLLSSPAAYEPLEFDARIGHAHRTVERMLEESGLDHTVLYPSWLATNPRRDWAEEIRTTGRLGLAHPDAAFSPIHIQDIADVAAELLTRQRFRGRTLVLTGPESLTQREVVAAIGEHFGMEIPIDELTKEEALARRPPWLPAEVLTTLIDVAASSVGIPATINNSIERITGHPARTFREWLAEDPAGPLIR
ncbi:SDR family oxidoreductase [Actinoalloteichus hymeniacidonis]|uniref:NAD(P)-binding domain-containing protein n=1 Tax=Actinoalloteichus hymeniacidonis TaxID=340345 RepID=A0AAC9HR09_9PSEU|nr:NAD(P)H-binding protein [Actinoalloteichus hymeniacidonis]AOS63641.1 hypothetical protein TL08_14135 [Actinoalloteichus hymeniacidonis]MBB5908310.1 uncharacterized protein YbjT (DUF2867 family) [Actinoalloteichus hymeniacidonis]